VIIQKPFLPSALGIPSLFERNKLIRLEKKCPSGVGRIVSRF